MKLKPKQGHKKYDHMYSQLQIFVAQGLTTALTWKE